MIKKKVCVTCDSKKSKVMMPCRVCELLDNDITPKEVGYCTICKAYICKADELNIVRRTKAFFKS